MKLLLIVVVCTVVCTNVYSQVESYPDTRIENTEGLSKAKIGTYQFIVHDTKVMPAFTNDILFFIERERKQSVDVVIPISEHVDLYIPSTDKINSKTYEALEEIEL